MLRRLGKDVLLYGGTDFLFKFAQFLAIPVYAHLLSVEDFAIMALVMVSAGLLGAAINLGVNSSVQRLYFDPDTKDRAALVTTGLVQLAVVSIAVVAAALLILHPLREGVFESYAIPWTLIVIGLLTIVPEQISQYALDAVRLQFSPGRFFAIGVIKNLLGVLIGLVLLIYFEMGVAGILLGTLIGAAAAVPVGLLMMHRDLAPRVDAATLRAILHYGYPLVFTAAAYWVFGSMNRWMLMELSDIEEVGLFSIAFRFAAVLTFVIGAFAQAWGPFAFRMHGEDPRYRENYAIVFSGWFFLLALLGLGLALFSREALMLVTPPAYWDAAPMLGISAAGLVLQGTTQLTMLGISLERRTILLTYGAWMAAAANVILNFLLIPRFGGVGAAVSTFLSYVVLTSSFLYWTQKLHPIPLEKGKLLYSCGLVALTVAAGPAVMAVEMSAAATAVKAVILVAAALGGLAVGIVDPGRYRRLFARRAA